MNATTALFAGWRNANGPEDEATRASVLATLRDLPNRHDHLTATAPDGTIAVALDDGARVFVTRETYDPIVWFDAYAPPPTFARTRFYVNTDSVLDVLDVLGNVAWRNDRLFALIVRGGAL